jgi:hypothetical protein
MVSYEQFVGQIIYSYVAEVSSLSYRELIRFGRIFSLRIKTVKESDNYKASHISGIIWTKQSN